MTQDERFVAADLSVDVQFAFKLLVQWRKTNRTDK